APLIPRWKVSSQLSAAIHVPRDVQPLHGVLHHVTMQARGQHVDPVAVDQLRLKSASDDPREAPLEQAPILLPELFQLARNRRQLWPHATELHVARTPPR